MKTTSEFIKKILELTKLSQTDLAKKLNKPTPRINEWLNGTYRIKFDEAMNFCQLLGINPVDIFYNEGFRSEFKANEPEAHLK